MDVLLGEQHGESLLLELDDGIGHLLDAAHVGAAAIGYAAEVWKDCEQLVGRPRRRRHPVGKTSWRLAADVEIFHDREVGEDAAILRHEAETAARDLVG